LLLLRRVSREVLGQGALEKDLGAVCLAGEGTVDTPLQQLGGLVEAAEARVSSDLKAWTEESKSAAKSEEGIERSGRGGSKVEVIHITRLIMEGK
jgi:hypothetical protein